jgi:hypothetical protein
MIINFLGSPDNGFNLILKLHLELSWILRKLLIAPHLISQQKAAKQHRLEDTTCQWTGSKLGGRKITATLTGETLEGSVNRGCLQWGVLAPLLWSLVVGELITGLNGNGCYTLGYADDIAILISGKSRHRLTASTRGFEYGTAVV